MEELKIAFISDIHYGYPEDEDMEEYLEPVVEKMVDKINEFSPDIVVSLGDFIQHSERETDLERLEKVGELLSGLETGFYGIPGNHDPMTVSKEEVIENIGCLNDEPYFSVELKDRKLVFLDTIRRFEDLYGAGFLGKDQREWLEKELDTGKEVIVFSHHLLHHRDLDGNWYFDDKPELAACIDKKNFNKIAGDQPRAVFSAHIHDAGLEEFLNIPHFTTDGMDKYNPPEQFEENHAFATIKSDKIVFETPNEKIEYSR